MLGFPHCLYYCRNSPTLAYLGFKFGLQVAYREDDDKLCRLLPSKNCCTSHLLCMPSLTSYYSSCSTTVPHPGVHPLFCLMGTFSSQQWKFVRQKDTFRTLWLRAASNNPNYMRLVTTQWFILPYYVSCTHHHKEILELWTRLFVSHCHTTRNTFPLCR